MAVVEGQQVDQVVALGKDDEGRVGQAEVEIGILIEDLVRPGDVVWPERLELVDTVGHLTEERPLRRSRNACRQQVVEFG